MLRALFIYIIFAISCTAQTVEEISEKVIITLNQMSEEWKSVKDQRSSKRAGKKSLELANTLSTYAEELKKLPRPDNITRKKITTSRKERSDKIGKEMAKTITLLMANAPLIAAFASELEKIKPIIDESNKTFQYYFEPNSK